MPASGGYDAKVSTVKKCRTELAFKNIPEYDE
jgi:hypothetical protein